MKFLRELGLKRSLCKTDTQFRTYIRGLNGKTSLYMSLYSFDSTDPQRPWRVDYTTAIMDRAWWDFDSQGDIEQVKRDVAVLLSRIKQHGSDIRMVATGRGFHIHQMLSHSVRGRDWSNKLQHYEREMGKGLETLDGVGYPEKITRIPDTFNPKRNRWCVVIDTTQFMADPLGYIIPKKPDPSLKSHCPYRAGDALPGALDIRGWVAPPHSTNGALEAIPAAFLGGDGDTVPIPPCLDRAIRVNNPRHEIRVALVQHMAENLRWFGSASTMTAEMKKSIEDQITQFISTLKWNDYNEGITRKAIRTLLKYDRTPSCAWFVSRNLCPGQCWRYDGTVKITSGEQFITLSRYQNT
tara:strand:- start:3084 stop:4142 length:1059 start_codon:yes stop_codon:yes gene_type:complete